MAVRDIVQAAAGVSTGNPNAWDVSKAYYDAGPDAGDVSTAIYSGLTFSFASQISANAGTGLAFKTDGTKCYATNSTTVYQYSLSTAWTFSTASYDSKSFSVSSQETAMQDVAFKPDGTKMYIVGGNNTTVYQYSLSTAWDVSSASYDSVSFSVASQDAAPRGLFFKPDGTKMYIAGAAGVDINEYDLSSAWDVSSASYVQNFSVSGQESTPEGVSFLGDGTKMYVVGSSGDEVNEYSLSTPWDISSASYVQTFSLSTQTLNPKAIFMKPDGSLFFVYSGVNGSGTGESTGYQYVIGGFSVAAQDTFPNDVYFNTDGTKMFVAGDQGNDINEYALATAWDITTATFDSTFSVASQETGVKGFAFKTDGTKMYVIGLDSDKIHQYDLSVAWDISTASYASKLFSVASQETFPTDVAFKSDGTKAYIVGYNTDAVYQYSLATAWDISTASYDSVSFSVSAQESIPDGLFFKPDGKIMYIIGQGTDTIHQYSLSTAWDVSSASYTQEFYLGLGLTTANGLFWKDDGTQFWVSDAARDGIFSFSISEE